MRTSAIVAAAFVAAATAIPMAGKREIDIVTDIDVVYVTDIVTKTVTPGYSVPVAPASSSPAAPASSAPANGFHWGHHSWHHHHHSSKATSKASPVSTKSLPPPSSTPEAPASTSSPAPPPPPPSSTPEAPTTTSTPPPPPPPPTSSAPPATTYAPKPTTSAAPAPPATSLVNGGPVGSANYIAAVESHHNCHRSNHSATDIAWDDNLAQIAKSIADTCVYGHNVTAGGGGYGQNIAAGVVSGAISEVISNLFYDGEVNAFEGLYGQANPDMSNFEAWGHFSQVVWKGSTKVGCWTTQCDSLANTGGNVPPHFTVCNYSPPGNYGGEYGDNIGEPKGNPSVLGGGS